MIEWISLGVAVFTLISWMITTYLSFMRNRPKLVVKAPRYIFEDDKWEIYVYNEGNRATRIHVRFAWLQIRKGKGKKKIHTIGNIIKPDGKRYVNVEPGAFYQFYTEYSQLEFIEIFKTEEPFFKKLQQLMTVKMIIIIHYDNGRRMKSYSKEIKLNPEDVEWFIDNKNSERRIGMKKNKKV